MEKKTAPGAESGGDAAELRFRQIAHIECDLPTKFGVPRQSGFCDLLRSVIVFEKEYRRPEALRGIEGYSHLWLLWLFSESIREDWSPTVRPPRLGGNTRMGVFATRSPFRPNPIGLSAVKLLGVEHTPDRGDVLIVGGADLIDGTPILDIKPYLPFADCRPDAVGGFADGVKDRRLSVSDPQGFAAVFGEEKRAALIEILAQDPRPSYQEDPERVYGFPFAGKEIRFRVRDGEAEIVGITADAPNEMK